MSQDLKQFMVREGKKIWLKTLAYELSQCKGIKKWSWPESQWQHEVTPAHLIWVRRPVDLREGACSCFVFISATVCLRTQNMLRHSWPHYILRQRGNLQTNTDLNFSPRACKLTSFSIFQSCSRSLSRRYGPWISLPLQQGSSFP